MSKVLNATSVKTALRALGWTQKRLAEELGVTGQAVTNWLGGEDFPRPPTLLKLATALRLGFNDLVASTEPKPVVAYRKKAATKTTEDHILKAMAMGALLKPVAAYLPARHSLRTQIQEPSLDYDALQADAANVRQRLGIAPDAELRYEDLISEFKLNDAVIIPVRWGSRKNHSNALHILLPEEKLTFIYLNLDTHLEDFKFWMAHELAHVYTPLLAGSDDGEDFADAMAGALLFPKALAQKAYRSAMAMHGAARINALRKHAQRHSISLYSVFCETVKFAEASGLPRLDIQEKDIHAVRNMTREELVSELLFDHTTPAPGIYIDQSSAVFKTGFFEALRTLVKERGTGPGYLQQLLDVSPKDAAALQAEMVA